MAPRTDRKLAAILAADVVGYSRLVGNDEAGTIARVKALRKECLEPLVAEYHGRVVKLMGDGALVEFASAVDAVECAVAIQKGVTEREGGEHEDRRIAFRIGINIGDIILEDGDIYGDGVNVVPLILDPLPDVAVHVVKTPGVRWVGANLRGLADVMAVVRVLGRDFVAPRVARRRSRAGGVAHSDHPQPLPSFVA
jgi:hypothetical protein